MTRTGNVAELIREIAGMDRSTFTDAYALGVIAAIVSVGLAALEDDDQRSETR